MTIFKCKMCGAPLEVKDNESVIKCDYCSTEQTLPKLVDERIANLYDRANHFRRNNDYDKAMSIYESILNDNPNDAESYWSIVLCEYGIEYVEDPKTKKRIPTVNRVQYTSIFDDDNYKMAIKYADLNQKVIYQREAETINNIQKGILEISSKEEPFDVFICYKETDENGRRTRDSVLANELYHELTQEGYKVFYSRITLEDKIGSAYEPYIFAALNSAKVMVVLGTNKDYFNAVWVKNEWSRYLTLIKNGQRKTLIPAYKDMDAYDLPDEFSHLQALNMDTLGFMLDLVRGIKKIVGSKEEKLEENNVVIKEETKTNVKKEIVNVVSNGNVEALVKRVFIFLEDGEFEQASEYCEKVLDLDPTNGYAYAGKTMVEYKLKEINDFSLITNTLENNGYYNKMIKYADEELAKIIDNSLSSSLCDAIEKKDYNEVLKLLNCGASANSFEIDANRNRYYILNRAIQIGNYEIVKLLLEKGADPNSERLTDNGGLCSALSDSISDWPNDEIAEILINNGANVNFTELYKSGAKVPILNSAIYKGNVKIVKLLLEKGADPNSERLTNNGDLCSALSDSIYDWPNDEIAEILINNGANVNFTELYKSGAKVPILNNAICKGNVKIVKLLLEKGADPNSKRICDNGTIHSALWDSKYAWPNIKIEERLKRYIPLGERIKQLW